MGLERNTFTRRHQVHVIEVIVRRLRDQQGGELLEWVPVGAHDGPLRLDVRAEPAARVRIVPKLSRRVAVLSTAAARQ